MNTTFLILINSRSGGQDGQQLVQKFSQVLDKGEMVGDVVNISDVGSDGKVVGPSPSLQKFSQCSNLRIIVCGGDGTVGWVLSALDDVSWKSGLPPVAIIPLGTGNDLSRSLHWGGKYKDKPLRKLLHDVATASVERLDRWKIEAFTITEDGGEVGESNLMPDENSCFSNYFSLGIDAHIALQFHNARNDNMEKFASRTRNLLFYGLEGGKDIFLQRWKKLMDVITVSVWLADGTEVDITKQLKDYGAHTVLFLNIKHYSGGTRPFKQKPGHTATPNDGLIEVIALDNIDLALLHFGGSGAYICQAKKVVLKTAIPVPMQVDGEPILLDPCLVRFQMQNSVNMLTKRNTSYPFRDPDVDDWAARKIQSSFKQYKEQKSKS